MQKRAFAQCRRETANMHEQLQGMQACTLQARPQRPHTWLQERFAALQMLHIHTRTLIGWPESYRYIHTRCTNGNSWQGITKHTMNNYNPLPTLRI